VEAALAQVAAAQRFLTRTRSVWAIASEDRETEEGAQERYFWLIAPHCPRPAARKILPLAEPGFVSLEEVEEEFPILPHWAGPDGKITPTVE
jgi:hypothetical protein